MTARANVTDRQFRNAGKRFSCLRFSVAAIVAVFVLAPGSVALVGAKAEESRSGLTWMSGETITSTFSGKMLKGLYPNGNVWTEKIFADSTTDYREGPKHWLGNWWVTEREFCFAYPPPGQGGCFRVTKISANCFELYDFTGDLARKEEPPHIADRWNGRMWHHDRPTTCEEKPSS